jgi:hypothetical protein
MENSLFDAEAQRSRATQKIEQKLGSAAGYPFDWRRTLRVARRKRRSTCAMLILGTRQRIRRKPLGVRIIVAKDKVAAAYSA